MAIYKIKFLGRYRKVKPAGLTKIDSASGKKKLAIKLKLVGKQPRIKKITGGYIIIPTPVTLQNKKKKR